MCLFQKGRLKINVRPKRPHKTSGQSRWATIRLMLYVLYTIQKFFFGSDVILHLTLEVIMSVITDVFFMKTSNMYTDITIYIIAE